MLSKSKTKDKSDDKEKLPIIRIIQKNSEKQDPNTKASFKEVEVQTAEIDVPSVHVLWNPPRLDHLSNVLEFDTISESNRENSSDCSSDQSMTEFIKNHIKRVAECVSTSTPEEQIHKSNNCEEKRFVNKLDDRGTQTEIDSLGKTVPGTETKSQPSKAADVYQQRFNRITMSPEQGNEVHRSAIPDSNAQKQNSIKNKEIIESKEPSLRVEHIYVGNTFSSTSKESAATTQSSLTERSKKDASSTVNSNLNAGCFASSEKRCGFSFQTTQGTWKTITTPTTTENRTRPVTGSQIRQERILPTNNSSSNGKDKILQSKREVSNESAKTVIKNSTRKISNMRSDPSTLNNRNIKKDFLMPGKKSDITDRQSIKKYAQFQANELRRPTKIQAAFVETQLDSRFCPVHGHQFVDNTKYELNSNSKEEKTKTETKKEVIRISIAHKEDSKDNLEQTIPEITEDIDEKTDMKDSKKSKMGEGMKVSCVKSINDTSFVNVGIQACLENDVYGKGTFAPTRLSPKNFAEIGVQVCMDETITNSKSSFELVSSNTLELLENEDSFHRHVSLVSSCDSPTNVSVAKTNYLGNNEDSYSKTPFKLSISPDNSAESTRMHYHSNIVRDSLVNNCQTTFLSRKETNCLASKSRTSEAGVQVYIDDKLDKKWENRLSILESRLRLEELRNRSWISRVTKAEDTLQRLGAQIRLLDSAISCISSVSSSNDGKTTTGKPKHGDFVKEYSKPDTSKITQLKSESPVSPQGLKDLIQQLREEIEEKEMANHEFRKIARRTPSPAFCLSSCSSTNTTTEMVTSALPRPTSSPLSTEQSAH